MTHGSYDSGSDDETLVEPAGGPRTLVDDEPLAMEAVVTDLPEEPAGEAADDTFGARYELESLLGVGGMGEVHLCRDRHIGRRVALKTLHEGLKGGQAVRRFRREAYVQGQLEHPSVVPVYDMGVDSRGREYFTMKRVRGVTLEDVIQGLADGDEQMMHRFTRRKLLTAFTQVCLAIDFGHRRGVVHRDLKPSNIMLGDYGEVYVLDWGLARVVRSPDAEPAVALGPIPDSLTRPGAVQGTPGYMSPEQVLGKSAEPASDVFALGAILFEILTLIELIPHGPPTQVVAATVAGVDARASVRAPYADVPPELEAICVRATAKKTKDRYANARELHDAVEAYLDGQRDHELRQRMAQAHADRAGELTAAAESGGPIDTRREALQEIGRCLTLDPDNDEALDALERLLVRPPQTAPQDVKTRLAASEGKQIRRTARLAALCYLSFLLLVPFALWAGVRDGTFLVPVYVLMGASVLISWLTARALRPSPRAVLAVMMLSNLMLMMTLPICGALVFMPPLVVVNSVACALILPRKLRWGGVIATALLCLGAMLLDAMGVFGAAYRFDHEGMHILARGIDLSAGATVALLCTAFLWSLVMGAVVAGWVKDLLQSSEEQLQMYAWHLRALVPRRSGKLTARLGR